MHTLLYLLFIMEDFIRIQMVLIFHLLYYGQQQDYAQDLFWDTLV
ncbi:hypothetical protein HMPREF9346_03769 [Escherichia coli MS 119-7]|nr:hypothetical protein HMPREF9346_03769 [Escherichia coli MS 119-7]